MKILFDHQILSLQKAGGISRYFTALYDHLYKYDDVEVSYDAIFSENIYHKGKFRLPIFFSWKIRQLFYFFVNSVFLFLKIKSYDIYHPTYYVRLIPHSKYKKLVVTVYDMIHEETSRAMMTKLDRTIEAKRRILSEADYVIALSKSTKNKLIEYYRISADKIKVIYLASKDFPIENKLSLPSRYILFVGTRSGYKNFELYVESTKDILKKKNISLVCFGGGVFTREEINMFRSLEIDSLVMHVEGDDSMLAYAYKNAIFLAFPSLMEGFGLPILEAFSLSCPVLTSNCSSMKEVAENAAILVDPQNKRDLYEKTLLLLSDEKLRKTLVQKGIIRSKNFSWDKTVTQTLAVYREILSS